MPSTRDCQKWLLIRDEEVELPRPRAAVEEQIASLIEPPRLLPRMLQVGRPYFGLIEEGRFCIRRGGLAGHGFRPLIEGEIVTSNHDPGSTRVRFVARSRWRVVAFMVVWLGLALIGGVGLFLQQLLARQPIRPSGLLLPAMIVVPYLFWRSRVKAGARDFRERLLAAVGAPRS